MPCVTVDMPHRPDSGGTLPMSKKQWDDVDLARHGRANNYWHVLLGIVWPLASQLLQNGICGCTPRNSSGTDDAPADGAPAAPFSCRCGCAHLIDQGVSPELLARLLAPLPEVRITPRMDGQQATAYLKRCDAVYHSRGSGASRRGSATYFTACAKEKVWVPTRRLFGGLLGLDLSRWHRKEASLALFVPRTPCTPYESLDYHNRKHVHHSVCTLPGSAKLDSARRAMGRRGWTTRVFDFPRESSLAAQARAFAGASIIVGGHGASMTNMLWARPGTLVAEITPYLYAGASLGALRQRQAIRHGRKNFQLLARYLSSVGVAMAHVAIPAALVPLNGTAGQFGKDPKKVPWSDQPQFAGSVRCDDWGCLEGEQLAAAAVDARAAMHDSSGRWRTAPTSFGNWYLAERGDCGGVRAVGNYCDGQ